MKTQTAVPTVTIREIAGALQATPEGVLDLCKRYDLEVVEDWQGFAALTAADAQRLITAEQEARRQHAENTEAYNGWIRQRFIDRKAVGDKAYLDVVEKRRARDAQALGMAGDFVTVTQPFYMSPSPQTRDEARAARDEALEKFDQKNPELSFTAWAAKKR